MALDSRARHKPHNVGLPRVADLEKITQTRLSAQAQDFIEVEPRASFPGKQRGSRSPPRRHRCAKIQVSCQANDRVAPAVAVIGIHIGDRVTSHLDKGLPRSRRLRGGPRPLPPTAEFRIPSSWKEMPSIAPPRRARPGRHRSRRSECRIADDRASSRKKCSMPCRRRALSPYACSRMTSTFLCFALLPSKST